MKKTLWIILGIVILAAVGTGVYLYLHRPSSGSTSSSFGFGGSSSNPTGEGASMQPSASPNANTSAVPASAIRQLHQAPVSGFGITTDAAGNVTVRYQERALGHVFETKLPDGNENAILKETQPTAYESYWGTGNAYAFVRSMDASGTVSSSLLSLPSGTETDIPGTIRAATVSPDAAHFFYLAESGQGAAGYSMTADGANKKQLFSSPLSEWLASWTNPSAITLLTKPSAQTLGSLYALDARSGGLKPLIANKPGLTGTLSPDGKTVLYAMSTNGGITTGYQDVGKGTSTPAPFTTLPEKCVWSTQQQGMVFCAIPRTFPRGQYPDDWYRGAVSFSDSIWKFDARSGSPFGQVIVDQIPGVSIDALSLALDRAEHYLVFINKTDGSLWSIDLNQLAPANGD